MLLRRLMMRVAMLVTLLTSGPLAVEAQQAKPAAAVTNSAQRVLDRGAQEGKYTFLLFYKSDDKATQAMAQRLTDRIANEVNRAVVARVQIGNPTDKPLVDKYDVSRAPMPLTIAIAPNGAITGMFSKQVTTSDIDGAFVTPTLMQAIKSLQDGNLVLVAVLGSANAPAPVAIKDFQSDAHFKDRIVAISLRADDPRESPFVRQMKIDPTAKETHTVLLAPPAAMVGKFSASASKNEIASALAKAGKCCDDPNCQHHQQPPRTSSSSPAKRKN